jgi:hypothetical protein
MARRVIVKVESNKDKQGILPNDATKVRILGNTSWKPSRTTKRMTLETTIQVELPPSGLPNVIRFRFCRYPNTAKADYTGHFSYPVHPGMAGKEVWVTLAHSILVNRSMNIAVYVDHDGASPIVLDGRQFKAN